METIVTGTPGNGKTAHVIDLVWFDKSSIWYALDKYVDGIADLKLEHFEFPDIKDLKKTSYEPLSQVDSDEYACWLPDNPHYPAFVEARATAKTAFDLWFLWLPPKSVLIVDEAQRYLRPRPAGAPVPLAIQMIEYHRHFGVHMIFITQKERLLHTNVRMLAGQHIHLTSGWRGRHRFEWPECKDSDSKTEKSVSAHTAYKLPVHVFASYKSTVENLKVKHKTPMFFYLTVAAGLAIPVLFYFAYASFNKPKKSAPAPVVSTSSTISAASGVSSASVSGVPAVPPFEDFMPVVVGRPETAPAFNSLRRVVNMPLIAGCLQSAKHCYCYTQQGTRIFDMPEESCVSRLAQGRSFNPYAVPVGASVPSSASGFSRSSPAQFEASADTPWVFPEHVTQHLEDKTRGLISASLE